MQVIKSLRTLFIVIAIAAAVVGALALYSSYDADRIARAHPPEGRFVEVDGGRIHYVELGPPGAPAVVLLHGACVNLGDMRLALGEKLAADYRVILIDRPGHGWSERPGGRADASPARQAKIIREALERIGVARAIIVAHSWSGALATALALDYPKSVAGLVLLAPVTHPWPNRAAWPDSVITALISSIATSAAAPVGGRLFSSTLAIPIGRPLLRFGVENAFAPQRPPEDYLAQSGTELLFRPAEFAANAEDIAQIHDFLAQQAPRYREIRAPTIVITGDADEALSPAVHAQAVARAIPHAKLVTLPGVGHMVHYAAPGRIVAAIAEIADADARRLGLGPDAKR